MLVFTSVLIANRGEIACRIMRTLRNLGVRSVAVYSAVDADAPHVRLADEAVALHDAESGLAGGYLSVDQIIAAALATGAEAIHPGYGFLSEQPALARACADAGLVFIGPSSEALDVMGDKIRARARVGERGVPVVPGVSEPGLSDAALIERAARLSYPVLVKPAAGGGGKGMHPVVAPEELPAALAIARREARASFGDDTLFIEQLIERPRHIEVQIIADGNGTVLHLGERECSLQRRHQKVIEEAPAPKLGDDVRTRLADAAIETARSIDYRGAGTVEFIVSAADPHEFAFMEMNTRLQVEHPVTEAVTGLDIVELQVRVAAGEPLRLTQADIRVTGHAIEARVYAEDPQAGFLPTGGVLETVALPEGAGIRVDAALAEGLTVTPDYDPMLAKVIAWAPDRAEAVRRLHTALADTVTIGVKTNVEFLRLLLDCDEVVDGTLDTGMIERIAPELAFRAPDERAFAAAALLLYQGMLPRSDSGVPPPGWRIGEHAAARFRLRVAADTGDTGDTGNTGGTEGARTVYVSGTPAAATVRVDDGNWRTAAVTVQARSRGAVGSTGPGRTAGAGRMTGAGSAAGAGSTSGAGRSTGAGDTTDAGNTAGTAQIQIAGRATHVHFAAHPRAASVRPGSIHGALTLVSEGVAWQFEDVAFERAARTDSAAPELLAPMPGTVVAIHAAEGSHVSAGQSVISIEAMKMEHLLRAPVAGTVGIRVSLGQQVTAREVLAEITPAPKPSEAEARDAAAEAVNGAGAANSREARSEEASEGEQS